MKGKMRTWLATAVLTVFISLFFCSPAFADAGSVRVKVEKGDTMYGLCQELGINYNRCKSAIMRLNGFTRESQLNSIQAGTELLLPTADSEANSLEANSGDFVAYYLMTYKFREGDTLIGIYRLWGMDFDDFDDDIRYLNNMTNLDKIPKNRLLRLPTNAANVMGNDYVTVMGHCMKSGESVYDIVQGYGLDYYEVEDKLVEYNCGRDLTKIQVGEVLKIPFDY